MKFKNVPFWFAMLVTAIVFYLIDCLIVVAIEPRPNLPWYKNGFYAKGPFGIAFTIVFGVAAVWHFVFARRK